MIGIVEKNSSGSPARCALPLASGGSTHLSLHWCLNGPDVSGSMNLRLLVVRHKGYEKI